MQNQEGIVRLSLFYKPDLQVCHYKSVSEPNRKIVFDKPVGEAEYYYIFLIYSGGLEYLNSGNATPLSDNRFVICKPNEPCKIYSVPNVDTRYCIINFSGRLFDDDESQLLRAFNNRKSGEDNIYSIDETANPPLVRLLIDSFSEYAKKRLSKAHYSSIIKMLASEICIVFDKTHPNDVERYSDEYDLRIYDFICRNFNKNITIDTVTEKFFVSRWYVNNLCHRFYQLPFKQMITDIRMWYARGLFMRNEGITMVKVAQLCGYKEYSAFFRAYNNYFGVSPKEDYEKYISTGSFFNLPT